ncbi:hypothetical protein ACW9KT_15280 [Hymenobacter sp. HD11105]
MKKIFLLLSCAGALTFASCSSENTAETDDRGVTKVDDDGDMKTEYADGTKVKTEADGDVKVKRADGSKVKMDSDGEAKIKSE